MIQTPYQKTEKSQLVATVTILELHFPPSQRWAKYYEFIKGLDSLWQNMKEMSFLVMPGFVEWQTGFKVCKGLYS